MPAIAVPKDEPRFEMLRDSPEISPCSCFGEARLHDVHRGGEHRAEAEADQCQPGHERPDAVGGADEAEQDRDPGDGDDEAGDDQRPLGVSLREALRGEGGEEDARAWRR